MRDHLDGVKGGIGTTGIETNMTKLVMLWYSGAMRTAKISELKAKLSAHIQFVKNGEEVLILDRNTPVAGLVSLGH